MRNIVVAVCNELNGKNPSLDVIKMLVRVAVRASGKVFTNDELVEMVTEIIDKLPPFDPFAPVLTCKAE